MNRKTARFVLPFTLFASTFLAAQQPAPASHDVVIKNAMVMTIMKGAHIVRVHDVKPAVEAARLADEVLTADGRGFSRI